MAKCSKTLLLIASKLELGEDERILSKAAEFERLLQSKSTASNISDTAKLVICLDLAASFFNSGLDVKSAIKCSGLKSAAYNNSRKVVENLLELNSSTLTTSMLCVSLQCGAQELADQILDGFRKRAIMELDLNLPHYVCMAVHQACRISKIKVSKSKLIEKSRLKHAQWTKMEAEWTKFVDDNFATVKKKGRGAKNTIVEKENDIVSTEIDVAPKKEDTEPQIEPYADWKKRILENAYSQLKKIQHTEQKNSPRKNRQNDEIFMVQIEDTKSPRKLNQNNENKLFTSRESPKKYPSLILNRVEDMEYNDSPKKRNKVTDSNKQVSGENALDKLESKQISIKDALDEDDGNVVLTFNTKQLTPRRSPRKTPQKYEPYKSPAKIKGVRLLFTD